MGGSRVEEEARGTVVCWDMVFLGFCFFLLLWCWMGVVGKREGGRWWRWDRLREERERERS